MDLRIALEHRRDVEEFQRKHRVGLFALLFTDIVGSTELKQRWGDLEAVALIHRHHALVREILEGFNEAQEISTAGDSCFLVFTKPSDSVKFALLLQARLRAAARHTGHPVFDRIGIHVGEVFVEEKEEGGQPKDLYGIQVDTCARIMALGKANQILMSRFAFDSARQVLKGQELEGVGQVSWLNHGPYLLKGVEETVEICEVGEVERSILEAPSDSPKARRFITEESEPVLGWRPAVEQPVPGTSWVLKEKLGEGGFGEVWRGWHEVLRETKVFKFCFRADRVRSLKREVTLFQLLKERVGRHPNITGIHEVYFDQPPYYIIMDYAGGKDLASWCAARGGVAMVPLSVRLNIVIQAAEGLQAAHEAGVIHRDIKPSNILLIDDPADPEEVQVRLTDFGIGQIVSTEVIEGLTRLGFTQTMMPSSQSSQGGTLIYMAPELMAGNAASPQSDLYSLGVVFYQLLVADLARPMTMDWVKHVEDPLFQDDLVSCLAGDPISRFASVKLLAASLRKLDERRAARLTEGRAIEARKRRGYLLHLAQRASLVLLLVALVAGGVYFVRERQAMRYGAVAIQSFPEGAEVWLKGERVGVTPYQATKLNPGKFTYSLILNNYERDDVDIVVVPGRDKEVIWGLSPVMPTEVIEQSTNRVEATEITAAFDRFTVVAVEGRVESCSNGTADWLPVTVSTVLAKGDRLRTGLRSRATLKTANQSQLRINQLTTLTISAPSKPDNRPPDFEPESGKTYFFERESPGKIQIRRGRIRG